MENIGYVSTEGGPLLIVDFKSAPGWTGIEGDYQRVTDRLNAGKNNYGIQVEIGGKPAVIWEMPTGTADVWRDSEDSLILCRPWLDLNSDSDEVLASLPPKDPTRIGRVRIYSGWVVVVWATETGEDIAANLPAEGRQLDLSVGSAGVIARLGPGEYDCCSDRVALGSESAVRCFIAKTGKP